MGGADRTIRILLALGVGALYYFDVIIGAMAYVLLTLAAIFILTSFIGFCPLYTLFGINTCKVKN